jgi:predicted RNA-binding protein
MCEFDVILNGKDVSKDVVYAKYEGGKVIIKDILRESWEYENCKIEEIDVNATRLVLSPVP